MFVFVDNEIVDPDLFLFGSDDGELELESLRRQAERDRDLEEPSFLRVGLC